MPTLQAAIEAENLRDELRGHARAGLMGEAVALVTYMQARDLMNRARAEIRTLDDDLSNLQYRLADTETEGIQQDLEEQLAVNQKRRSDLQALNDELKRIPKPDTPILRQIMENVYPIEKKVHKVELKRRY